MNTTSPQSAPNRKRPFIVAGNWKMNKLLEEAQALCKEIYDPVLKEKWNQVLSVILIPPFPYLHPLKQLLAKPDILYLGGQNCHESRGGAFTGEVSTEMLKSVGATYVLVGHSERRKYFGEKNDLLSSKINNVLSTDLTPIFCCGESLQVRNKNLHIPYVCEQISNTLFHLSARDIKKVVIAYEPIWAIGTGNTANREEIQEMHEAIRNHLTIQYDDETAQAIPILYGGSCKSENAEVIFSCPDVDGGLIGGASLEATSFNAILEITVNILKNQS